METCGSGNSYLSFRVNFDFFFFIVSETIRICRTYRYFRVSNFSEVAVVFVVFSDVSDFSILYFYLTVIFVRFIMCVFSNVQM